MADICDWCKKGGCNPRPKVQRDERGNIIGCVSFTLDWEPVDMVAESEPAEVAA